MTESPVLYHVRDQVAVITMNRPERLNAWTPQMEEEYFQRLEEAAVDENVRAIVLTGAGRGFCAGADMELLGEAASNEGTDLSDPRRFNLPLRIPKPIIGAINGPCAGIGLIHALMCDVRFIAADAKVTTAFTKRGLIAEYNMAWLLPRLVGQSFAQDLLLSARVITGEEAVAMGLASRALSDGSTLDVAMDYARALATECSPWAMAMVKQQVYRFLDTSLGDATELTRTWMAEGMHVPDLKEGVASFLDRRPPAFEPLPATPDATILAASL